MLAWTIYISFIGAALVALVPAEKPGVARVTALLAVGEVLKRNLT